MKLSFGGFPFSLALVSALGLAAPPTSAPAFENEQLRYSINWPSGLSLGEAELDASSSKASTGVAEQLHLQFNVDAGIPGFTVVDRYSSAASPDFCSAEFQRNAVHGPKKTDEKTTFDLHSGTATRETSGGGKTDLSTPQCAKDALTFLYYARHELSQGRIPPAQTVFMGSSYEVRLEYAGTQSIRLADKQVDADRVTASIKGPASSVNVEVFLLKDRTRTPALVRVPLALGTFSMELVR
jgi:Protein of unknown function (DUF3108)